MLSRVRADVEQRVRNEATMSDSAARAELAVAQQRVRDLEARLQDVSMSVEHKAQEAAAAARQKEVCLRAACPCTRAHACIVRCFPAALARACAPGGYLSFGPIEKILCFCDLSVREKDWRSKPGL